MGLQASWILQGFFKDLTAQKPPFMQSIRDELCKELDLPPRRLKIAKFPPKPGHKYLYWWREKGTEYAEAQFFAEVSKTHPVFSLGLAIEKGFDDRARPPKPRMNRDTWDWPRLVKHVRSVLTTHTLAAAKALRGEPVNLRIRSKSGDAAGWETRAFSFIDGRWFERHVGPVKADAISEHICKLDGQPDSWVIVHFASDLGPDEKDLSASGAAALLIAFDGMRRRVRT